MRTAMMGVGLWLAAGVWYAPPAVAVARGQSDGFDGGSTLGWTSGAVHPAPPVGLPDGGPGGIGDGFLQLTALGGVGPGSKLVAFAGPQWLGDWLSAGVNGVSLDLINAGPQDLSLRLYVVGRAGSAISRDALALPAGGGWTAGTFDLQPGALEGQPLLALADVVELRLFHGEAPIFPGDAVQAVLGIDNVTAVPEPAPAALLSAGLLLFALRRHTLPGLTRRRS